MRVLGIDIPDDKQIQFSHLINIESIISECQPSSTSLSTNPESSSNFQSNLEFYFRSSFSPSPPQKLIDLVQSLSLTNIIRLYQIPQNLSRKIIEIKVLSDSLIKASLSLNDLIQKFYQNSTFPSNALCLVLPGDYELDCLNIFESFFQMGKLLWVLKGILLIRGKISACIIKTANKWVLNIIMIGTFTHTSLQSAVSAAADYGFIPAAFWYYELKGQVAKELINPQKIKAYELARLKNKDASKKRFSFDLRKAILQRFESGEANVTQVCGYKRNLDAPFSAVKEAGPENQGILEMNKRLVDKVVEVSIKTQVLQGLQGHQGRQGLQGLPGLQGHQGLQGLQGKAPEAVKSFKSNVDDDLGSSMFPLYETVEKQQITGLTTLFGKVDIGKEQAPEPVADKHIREFSIAIKRNRNSIATKPPMEEIKEVSVIAENYQTSNQFYCQYCSKLNGFECGICEHHVICTHCNAICFSNAETCYNCQAQF